MKNDLDFSLPNDSKQEPRKRRAATLPTVVSILLLIVLAVFVIQELLEKKEEIIDKGRAYSEKELAEKLEDRGLSLTAAQAWMRYVNKSALNKKEKARCADFGCTPENFKKMFENTFAAQPGFNFHLNTFKYIRCILVLVIICQKRQIV